ncbi:hypothetical protein FIBSPDRAFT_896681 [Athelia psychrophila]|uniref:Uncharacterized protein n=1 Tax=Athelia psychrophila TaxID=1759441 RepID=A0A166D4D8_9AGAM|nr:hypothetical protein FIBSPDRAFT_896681 [Fibularhizoctonia sp. CBS 109695]
MSRQAQPMLCTVPDRSPNTFMHIPDPSQGPVRLLIRADAINVYSRNHVGTTTSLASSAVCATSLTGRCGSTALSTASGRVDAELALCTPLPFPSTLSSPERIRTRLIRGTGPGKVQITVKPGRDNERALLQPPRRQIKDHNSARWLDKSLLAPADVGAFTFHLPTLQRRAHAVERSAGKIGDGDKLYPEVPSVNKRALASASSDRTLYDTKGGPGSVYAYPRTFLCSCSVGSTGYTDVTVGKFAIDRR